jgi:alpha-1,2-mannosyltransferase
MFSTKLVIKKKLISKSIFFTIAIISLIVNLLYVAFSISGIFDYGSFIASGRFANAGQNPYSLGSDLIFHVGFGDRIPDTYAPNLNPPITVMFFQTFAAIDPWVSIMIWRGINICLFIISILLMNKRYPLVRQTSLIRWVWVICFSGFWHTIQLGQIYIFVLLLTVIFWLLSEENRPIICGIILGVIIAIKPNFIFWAILYLVTKKWKTFIISGITASVISLFPIFKFGIAIYAQWLEATTKFSPGLLIFPGNNSFQGLTARFSPASIGIVISILFAISIAFYCWRKGSGANELNTLGIIGSLLISPIAWTGYTLLCLPVFYSESKFDWRMIIAGMIFMVPFPLVLGYFTLSKINFIIFGWLYGWGLLLLVWYQFRKTSYGKQC